MGIDKLLYLLVSCNLKEIENKIRSRFADFITNQQKYVLDHRNDTFDHSGDLAGIDENDWINLNELYEKDDFDQDNIIIPHNSIWHEFNGRWEATYQSGNGKNHITLEEEIKNYFEELTYKYFPMTEENEDKEDEILEAQLNLQFRLDEYFKEVFKNYTDHENGYQYKDNKIISLKEGWIKEYPINDYFDY